MDWIELAQGSVRLGDLNHLKHLDRSLKWKWRAAELQVLNLMLSEGERIVRVSARDDALCHWVSFQEE